MCLDMVGRMGPRCHRGPPDITVVAILDSPHSRPHTRCVCFDGYGSPSRVSSFPGEIKNRLTRVGAKCSRLRLRVALSLELKQCRVVSPSGEQLLVRPVFHQATSLEN